MAKTCDNPYIQLFNSLNIPVEPLPSNYNPDEFGKRLRNTFQSERGVSYATCTDYSENIGNHTVGSKLLNLV